MKFFLLFSSIFFILLHAKEQPFLITVDKPFDSILYAVTQDYDAHAVTAVGFSNSYKKSKKTKIYTSAFDYLADNSQNLYGKKSILLKMDTDNAAIIFEKFAKIKAFNKAVSVLKTPQNGYFLGGYTFDGSLLIAKLDANANVIFVRKFGTKNYDRMNRLIALSDGGVLAVGSSTTSRDLFDPMFRTGLGLNDIFLTRFDADGHMLWSKKYGTEHDDRGIDAVEAYDGSILVIAATTYEKHHDVTLMRIGENGDKIWLKHYQKDLLLTPKRIIRLNDENFVAVLAQQDSVGKRQICFIKFDLQKNVLLDTKLDTYYESELNDIREFSNGTYIAVGKTKDRYNTDALVMVLDENLQLLCQNHFGNENYDTFNALEILQNSQTVAVGVTTPKNSQIKKMLIAKIKPDCTLAKLQQQPKKETSLSNRQKLYKELQKLFKAEIEAAAITLSPTLSITLSGKNLLFAPKEYHLSNKQKKFLKPFTKKLLDFLQKHKEEIAALEIAGHTSSEWESAKTLKNRYNNNMNLSLKRSYSVSRFLIETQNKNNIQLLSKLLKDSGYSFAKRIKNKDGSEQKERSRRVVFFIVPKKS